MSGKVCTVIFYWSQTNKLKKPVVRKQGMAGLKVCILQDCIFAHGEKGIKANTALQGLNSQGVDTWCSKVAI